MDLWLEFTKLMKFLEKYGEDVFEIESNYTRCNIPFEREVIVYIDNKNVGFSVVLNKTEKKVIEILIENPRFKSIQLSKNRCRKESYRQDIEIFIFKENDRKNWIKA